MSAFIIRKINNGEQKEFEKEFEYYKHTDTSEFANVFCYTKDPLEANSFKSAALCEVMRETILERSTRANLQVVEMKIILQPVKLITESITMPRKPRSI